MKRRDLLRAASLMSFPLAFGNGDWADALALASQAALGEETDELAGTARGPWRRLFLDGAVIEQQAGLERRFYQATRHAEMPIIQADKPWEGKAAITGPYVYGSVLRENGKFRLWYQLLYQGNHVGYAESSDGIAWSKPELDVVSFEGQKTNLVVSPLAQGKFSGIQCHNPSVIVRRGETGSGRRYALYGFDGASRGPRVAFSEDGIHFQYDDARDGASDALPGLFQSSDVVSFFYDPYTSRYISTWKTRNRRGRAVGVAVSSDGLQWKKLLETPVFAADDHDPDTTQVYGMPVFAYQGLYIGLPWIYAARYIRYGEYSVDKLHEAQADSSRTIQPQLAWSWDLVNWTRPIKREPIIGLGRPGAWDAGMVVTARAPIVVNDELWFYYGGTDKVHDEPRTTAAIGLAKMRLDGFCSMTNLRAEGQAGAADGWLITRREPMLAPSVSINARTGPLGSIVAEILDRRNRVVPGFSRDQCEPFRGDSVAHKLTWNTAEFAGPKPGTDYKIRFWLRNAELFSYLPTELDPTQLDLARFPSEGP